VAVACNPRRRTVRTPNSPPFERANAGEHAHTRDIPEEFLNFSSVMLQAPARSPIEAAFVE
jgi:hypothetical protein